MDRNGATHGQRVQVSRHAGWYSSTAVTLAASRQRPIIQSDCWHCAGRKGTRVGEEGGEEAEAQASDAAAQAQMVFDNIEALMAEAGTSKSHVLSMNGYLADIARDYAAYNAVRKAWIDPKSKGT